MTQEEEKQILLQDLCARLPYGVKVDAYSYSMPQTLYSIDVFRREYTLENGGSGNLFVGFDKPIFFNIKPYLRPLNTITKSEIAAAIKYICDTNNVVWSSGTDGVGFYFYKSDGIKRRFDEFKFKLGCYGSKNIDWFNEHHFDYRGLIKMGLALPAPKGMYNIK